MKNIIALLGLAFIFNYAGAQQLKYTNANNSWNADSLGNHRVLLYVPAPGKITKAVIAWRRRDFKPQEKQILVVDAKTNKTISNVKVAAITREEGILYFEPVSGMGKYYVYYMPYQVDGRSNYPQAKYLKPSSNAAADWLSKLEKPEHLVNAQVMEMQSVNAMNSFYPMEVIATAAETQKLISTHAQQSFLVFPEDRQHPIKMTTDLPQRWIMRGPKTTFSATASPGENFAFQLGIYPLQTDLENVQISFNKLAAKNGQSIPAVAVSCLNTDGINYDGKAIHKTLFVAKGKVQALWCLINIPKTQPAGVYEGTATVTATGAAKTQVKIILKVKGTALKDGGVNTPKNQTRLAWLNSTMAQKNEVIKPYTPLVVNNQIIDLLGRRLSISKDGLPLQIQTFFTPEMTALSATPKNLFTEAVHFHVTRAGNHQDITFKNEGVNFTLKEPGTVKWMAKNTSDSLNMDINAAIEFDGAVAYTVKFIALQNISIDEIRLHLPFEPQAAKYLMGLGQKGGYRPDTLGWKWDVARKNQDGTWIGDVNGGLQYTLRDEQYVRPLNTNFYLQKPLLLPTSWGNGGKGGIRIAQKGKAILADNYSGPRIMKKGDTLYYNFTLLITPFHTIDTDFQWTTRFYHKYNNLDTIKATGATVVNIHHATPINPYINYPFIAHQAMKTYVDEAHRKGLKVKIYNTIRELSNSAYETFALRSLGHEIYSTGKGGGYAWLQEHLGDDYIAAWYVPEIKDAAVVNSGMSRWHNYYVEGMNWLVQNVGIDGIYLDDVAFDRTTMKRIKRVLTQGGHPGIIDLHSANQYNKNDGFNNSANLYLENFPYLNRLWFGEYFDYEKNSPDFFLTEVSGIPFGLMGEMLQGGGNPWRGMVYGMTNRMPWSDNADPRPIWKAWDDFGMAGSKMIGYWVEASPVKTGNAAIPATIYKKPKSVLIALASWASAETIIKLQIDWAALGIDPAKALIWAPEIKNFQPAAQFKPTDDIPVKPGKGWMLIIKER